MILSDRDQEIFFNALLNPPEANNELKNAFIDHDKMVDLEIIRKTRVKTLTKSQLKIFSGDVSK